MCTVYGGQGFGMGNNNECGILDFAEARVLALINIFFNKKNLHQQWTLLKKDMTAWSQTFLTTSDYKI